MLDKQQIAEFTELGIKNLAEVVYFLATALDEVNEALSDDGKISFFEAIPVALKLSGNAKAAYSDIAAVGVEAKDIDANKVERLADIIYPSLVHTFEGKPFNQVAVNRVIGLAVQLAHVVQLFRDKGNWVSPPKAKVVEDSQK